MSRGLLTPILYLAKPSVENPYWTNEGLVNEEDFKEELKDIKERVLDDNELERLEGVYIVGSVADMKNKKKVKRMPSDLDLFIQTDDFDWDLETRLRNGFPNHSSTLGLKFDVSISPKDVLYADEDIKVTSFYKLNLY